MTESGVFRKYCEGFHQDIFVVDDDMVSAIDASLSMLNTEEKSALALYTRNLLHKNHHDEEILSIWNRSSSDWYMTDARGVKEFLRMTLNRIQVSASKKVE